MNILIIFTNIENIRDYFEGVNVWGRKSKKRWYRYVIQLIVVALIVTSIPLNGLAETAPPFTPSPNSEQSPEVEKKEEKELPDPHPDQLKKDKTRVQKNPTEIIEERTETEKFSTIMMVRIRKGIYRTNSC